MDNFKDPRENIWQMLPLEPFFSPLVLTQIKLTMYFRTIFGEKKDFSYYFYLWWTTKSIKYILFTIYKCTVQSHQVHSQCCAIITTVHLQNSLHLLVPALSFIWTETPYLLNNNSPFPSSPSPWQPLFHLPYSWVWLLYQPALSGTTRYLSFRAWFISLSIVPSRFMHVVAGVRNLFLFGAE